MNKFYQKLQKYDWDNILNQIYSRTENDVKQALAKERLTIHDFQALISPAAEPYLELMAQKSMQITQKRFGKTIQMYIPLYISNACTNSCVYCGFNRNNKFDRTILALNEIMEEAAIIKNMGFKHILLVTGEDEKHCGASYIKEIIEELNQDFSHISIEVQPLASSEYKKMKEYGLNTVYIYQETYNEQQYPEYHPDGKKADFQYRLSTPERIGEAGVHKTGLGCLLGLEDWRTDSFFTALHLQFLEKHYWKTKYCISFPRLRPHVGAFQPKHPVTEKNLLQLICAYRLFNEYVEISLSTRESPKFRDHMLKLGITSFSAGSKTNPGGYANDEGHLEQFAVHDSRHPSEIAEMIQQNGYEVVWKDWDYYMQL